MRIGVHPYASAADAWSRADDERLLDLLSTGRLSTMIGARAFSPD
jgi:hypothetical protein